MFSWFYIYVVVILVVIGIIYWIWARFTEWWAPESATYSKNQTPQLQEISILENNNHHLFRLYTIETFAELESVNTTQILLKDNCNLLLALWEKILEKEHFLAFQKLQKEKWSLYFSIVEKLEETQDQGTSKGIKQECKKLRNINRKIAQLHEDWWGLKYDGSKVMKTMNEMDGAFISQVKNIAIEDYESSKSDFQAIFYYQRSIEEYVKNR